MAHAQGMSLAALREAQIEAAARNERRRTEMDRRSFLGAAALSAAAMALPRTADAGEKSPTIVIVGAGIAGLTCALELSDHGLPATVYEASGRVGGRMFSNTTYWDDKQTSEWCGELLDSNNHTIFALARRFDLPIDDLHAGHPPGSEDTFFFDGRHYPAAHALRDFKAICRALADDLRAAGDITTHLRSTPQGRALDRMSVHEWIETRVPGGHRSPLGKLLDVAYVIEWGAPSQDQSALNLVYFLARQPAPPGFSMFGVSDEKYHIRGGNERLPRAIAARLGPAVKLGHRLLRVRQTPAGRYLLAFQRGGSAIDVVADLVVLALPFAVLRSIDCSAAGFDERKLRAIQELGRARSGKLQIQFTRRGWNERGAWPGISNGNTYADTGYQNTWDVTRTQAGKSGILVFYSGAGVTESMATQSPYASAQDSCVVADARRGLVALEPVLPGVPVLWNGKATQSLPHKDPLRGAAYSYYRVGQRVLFGGHEGARQGGVLFCGEHTSMDFQGHMEGAAAEGKRAAAQLMRLCGRAVEKRR